MTTAQTPTQQTVLDTALGYFNAWTSRDVNAAMRFVADDIVFDAPFGRREGADALRDSLNGFLEIFQSVELIDAFADEHGATIIYMTQTKPVPNVPACEYLGVEDGKITYKRLIFDRGPFILAEQAAASGH